MFAMTIETRMKFQTEIYTSKAHVCPTSSASSLYHTYNTTYKPVQLVQVAVAAPNQSDHNISSL